MGKMPIMPGRLFIRAFTALMGFCLLGACAVIGEPGCSPDRSVPARIASAQKASCDGTRSASVTVGDYYVAEAERTGDNRLYKKAARFYKRAAETRSGLTFIYVPGAGKVAGYTMPVTTGPTTYGLPEAQAKLADLYYRGLGVKQDKEKACRIMSASLHHVAHVYNLHFECPQEPDSQAG